MLLYRNPYAFVPQSIRSCRVGKLKLTSLIWRKDTIFALKRRDIPVFFLTLPTKNEILTTLIIHVGALKEREEHMKQQLSAQGLDNHVFILDGDKDTLTPEVLEQWFDPQGEVYGATAGASCAMKHLLACRYVVDHELEGALVFEDDICLHRRFREVFDHSLDEMRREHAGEPVFISYEDSTLEFVPRSQRQSGKVLYPAARGRFAGAYYLNRRAAQAVIDCARTHKIHLPADHFYYYVASQHGMNCYWCQPAIATQGSFTGLFSSAIKQRRHGLLRLRWWLKLNYKKLLYNLR